MQPNISKAKCYECTRDKLGIQLQNLGYEAFSTGTFRIIFGVGFQILDSATEIGLRPMGSITAE